MRNINEVINELQELTSKTERLCKEISDITKESKNEVSLIQELLDEFPFDELVSYFEMMNIEWCDLIPSRVPTVKDLKQLALKLMEECYSSVVDTDCKTYTLYRHGFVVNTSRNREADEHDFSYRGRKWEPGHSVIVMTLSFNIASLTKDIIL